MSFFVDTGCGIEIYQTAAKAQKAAEDAIDEWRNCCDPVWDEEVRNVCWGMILGWATEIDVASDGPLPAGVDRLIDFKLDSTDLHRCNICGGLVVFDGTAPTIGFSKQARSEAKP